jgi:hypothetical protein
MSSGAHGGEVPRRITRALLVVALAPGLMGGGGTANTVIVGPTVEGIFVMDLHENDTITPLARHGAIYLRHKKLSRPEKVAAAVFTTAPAVELRKGCGTSLTTPKALDDIIREAEIIRPLFAELGITLTATMTPVIARVKKRGCTTGGAVPGIPEPSDGVGKGMYWMVVDLKMQVERP